MNRLVAIHFRVDPPLPLAIFPSASNSDVEVPMVIFFFPHEADLVFHLDRLGNSEA